MQDLIKRCKKGHSILKKIDDYTVVDIETTGLCPAVDEIIEIGALKVREGKIVQEFSTLVKPKFEIPSYITRINGISNDMVKDAPDISMVIQDFYNFVSKDIIIGFCPSFDVNFLYDACQIKDLVFDNDFIDTRQIAKILIPDFKEKTRRRYKLKNLVWYFKLGKQEHRALSDCIYTKQLYDKLNEIANEKGIDYTYVPDPSGLIAKNIKRRKTDVTLFEGEQFVFTGRLEYMTRREAMQYVVDYGGIVSDNLKKNTDYLVMGRQDYTKLVGKKSSKQRRAEEYIEQGEDINIITEDVFYDMIKYDPPDEENDESQTDCIWPSFSISDEEIKKLQQEATEEYLASLPDDKASYIRKKIDEGKVKIN